MAIGTYFCVHWSICNYDWQFPLRVIFENSPKIVQAIMRVQISRAFLRLHVPCFYRVIDTPVEVWEDKKCCGNTSRRRVFPQLFRVLPNFRECFYNSIETRKTCFLFLLENTATKKEKQLVYFDNRCKFPLLAPSQRQQLMLVLCFHRVIETWFSTSQRAYFHRTVFLMTNIYEGTCIRLHSIVITLNLSAFRQSQWSNFSVI